MINKQLLVGLYILLLSSCSSCKDDMVDNNVIWRTPLNQKSLIYDKGLGYPIYGNTVVFHSTPEPWGVQESILHGMDTKTGKEKWRLNNMNFFPKKDLRFNNVDYFYQNENVALAADCITNQRTNQADERYIYAIDIEKRKGVMYFEIQHSGTK